MVENEHLYGPKLRFSTFFPTDFSSVCDFPKSLSQIYMYLLLHIKGSVVEKNVFDSQGLSRTRGEKRKGMYVYC